LVCIFSPKLDTYFLVRAGGELQSRCVVAAEGLKPHNISHQEKDGYLFSPTSTAQWQCIGSAVEAQWKRSGCGG
jgi:hypothetical protein